jgi:hypothetical protein
MKQVFVVLLLFIAACNSSDKNALKMTGSYQMLSVSAKGKNVDTTVTSREQLKIYADDHMMYASVNPADSSARFGVGTYDVAKDTVTEHVFFTSEDSTKSDSATNYSLGIEKTPDGYKQVIPDMGTGDNKIALTEVYKNVGTDSTSSLDGVWKLTNALAIKGTDTTHNMHIQYKVYHAGYFMWGASYTDSANKIYTAVGFGTFTMTGANTLKETIRSSNISEIKGQSFDIGFTMNGTDEFQQTITGSDGTKSIETYQRLKK